MPLTSHEGVVAGVAQQLGQRGDSLVEIALVAGHAALRGGAHRGAFGAVLAGDVGPFDEVAQAGDVVVGAGHDHGAGWSILSA